MIPFREGNAWPFITGVSLFINVVASNSSSKITINRAEINACHLLFFSKKLSHGKSRDTHPWIPMILVSHSQTTTFLLCRGGKSIGSGTLALKFLCNVPLQSG